MNVACNCLEIGARIGHFGVKEYSLALQMMKHASLPYRDPNTFSVDYVYFCFYYEFVMHCIPVYI